MNLGLLLTIVSLAYVILITIIYFGKKRIALLENKIYEKLLIITIIGFIVNIISFYFDIYLPHLIFARTIMIKLYYAYLITFLFYMVSYLMVTGSNSRKIVSGLKWLYCVLVTINFFLGVEFSETGGQIYVTGANVYFIYLVLGMFIISTSIYLFSNIKQINKTKSMPAFIYIMLAIPILIVQAMYPELLLETCLISFVLVLMYHTIENPDLKMLREFHKAREYANNLNTEKSEFLFNMAGEIKTPISVINRISKEVLMQDDINIIKEKLNQIKYSSNNLLELVNKVLDINSLEKRKVSVRESKYNTTNLFKGIESQTELKLNNDLVEFRTNYDKSIPNELYGDSVRIRQIVNTLLENAIKYTKEGFIELSVNSIVKHDICRLVITVEDSGVGMTQDVVEHLFDKELEKIEEIDNPKMDLGLVKTLLDLIGGTIIVNSELNHGTKFTIVLDQKVVNHKKNKTIEAVEKYEEMYLNNKKIMCVINDETLSKKINTLFKKYQLDIEIVKLGQSCLEKVRAGEKFDLIIMEEHLEKLSSENTLAKLRSIQGFKTPVILLTDIKDINEKEEYLKLGFTEIVTLPLKKEQVEELVNNYVQEK